MNHVSLVISTALRRAIKAGAKIDWHNPEWDGATLLLRAARTGGRSHNCLFIFN